MARPPVRVFRSRGFLLQVYPTDSAGVIRLSINRTTVGKHRFEDGITWDELQSLKHQAGYGDLDAVEAYPRDADVVNVSNMRHLFVFFDRRPMDFIWRGKNSKLAAAPPAGGGE